MRPENPKQKKTLKLKIGEDVQFRLIGISSHENDYRLVWAINNTLGFQFTRAENLTIHSNALKTDLEFSRFKYTDEDRILTYSLISNHSPDGFLFSEIKNFDFLIKISGQITDTEVSDFMKQLKSVVMISASFRLEPKKLKGWRDIFAE